MDIMIPCLIINTIHESSKVKLTNNFKRNVRFGELTSIVRVALLRRRLSQTRSLGVSHYTLARRDSFERKMDTRTARDFL